MSIAIKSEDTKCVVRNHTPKKDRQYNHKKRKDKAENNGPNNTKRKLKFGQHELH